MIAKRCLFFATTPPPHTHTHRPRSASVGRRSHTRESTCVQLRRTSSLQDTHGLGATLSEAYLLSGRHEITPHHHVLSCDSMCGAFVDNRLRPDVDEIILEKKFEPNKNSTVVYESCRLHRASLMNIIQCLPKVAKILNKRSIVEDMLSPCRSESYISCSRLRSVVDEEPSHYRVELVDSTGALTGSNGAIELLRGSATDPYYVSA